MKVRIINQRTGQAEIHHMESSQARAMIATGLVEEVLPDAKPAPTVTSWRVQRGAGVEDFVHCPELIHTCSTCTNLTNGRRILSGPTSHLQKITHCGMVEGCPLDVQEQYLKLRKAWERRQPKTKPPAVTPSPAPKGYEPHPKLPNVFVRARVELE
jgi:hypothetical protein